MIQEIWRNPYTQLAVDVLIWSAVVYLMWPMQGWRFICVALLWILVSYLNYRRNSWHWDVVEVNLKKSEDLLNNAKEHYERATRKS